MKYSNSVILERVKKCCKSLFLTPFRHIQEVRWSHMTSLASLEMKCKSLFLTPFSGIWLEKTSSSIALKRGEKKCKSLFLTPFRHVFSCNIYCRRKILPESSIDSETRPIWCAEFFCGGLVSWFGDKVCVSAIFRSYSLVSEPCSTLQAAYIQIESYRGCYTVHGSNGFRIQWKRWGCCWYYVNSTALGSKSIKFNWSWKRRKKVQIAVFDPF